MSHRRPSQALYVDADWIIPGTPGYPMPPWRVEDEERLVEVRWGPRYIPEEEIQTMETWAIRQELRIRGVVFPDTDPRSELKRRLRRTQP